MAATPQSVVIYGAGEHGRVVLDSIRKLPNFSVLGFIDDAGSGDVMGVPILGSFATACASLPEHVAVVLGVGGVAGRKVVSQRVLEAGGLLQTVVDPSAICSSTACLGAGTFVGPGAIVHTAAEVGKACVINTGAIVEHDCVIGDHSEISVGVRMGGAVQVGADVFVGIGATVRDHVSIGDQVVVGAGAVVVKSLPANVVAYGVPAKVVREHQG